MAALHEAFVRPRVARLVGGLRERGRRGAKALAEAILPALTRRDPGGLP